MPAASAPLIPVQSALCAAPSRQIPADGPKGRETAPAPGFRRKHKRRCRDITAQHRLNSMEMHRLSSASGLAKGADIISLWCNLCLLRCVLFTRTGPQNL